MRIVAGRFKGRALTSPQGAATRPTSDRARAAVFNMLEHAPWAAPLAGARVIDLFSGTGALGLEALSRGAGHVLFVETAPAARAALQANVAALGVAGSVRVLNRDAVKLEGLDGPAFDLAFLDPPYRKGLAGAALDRLRDGRWLDDGAIVVVEQGADEPDLAIAGFEVLDARRYGAARITILQRAGP
jgi:16S rRNA (guanine966-N2)-methyltransferase